MRKTLAAVVGRHPATHLLPRAFMIAWHGVPSIVYQGFSPPLAAVKRDIVRTLGNLPPEAPGSRWPKTGLGALQDARPLSPEALRRLRTVCDRFTASLNDAPALRVTHLQWVHYECRSLERRLESVSMAMAPGSDTAVADRPEPNELSRVDSVLDGFSRVNLAAYLSRVNQEGFRIDYYRAKAMGRSLIFDLGDQRPARIDEFIEAVETVLPDRYAWFSRSSRHVTIRGLSN